MKIWLGFQVKNFQLSSPTTRSWDFLFKMNVYFVGSSLFSSSMLVLIEPAWCKTSESQTKRAQKFYRLAIFMLKLFYRLPPFN